MTKKQSVGAKAWSDPDDAPEITDEHFLRADVFEGERLIRRGRPKLDRTKKAISLRVDEDVLERFRDTGPGWHARMNTALRKAVGLS